jgi:hypothetical protein
MRYVRKVYNMNSGQGRYPAISFPPELADMVKTGWLILETCPEGILIRPSTFEPVV